jgi:hypothetical protein
MGFKMGADHTLARNRLYPNKTEVLGIFFVNFCKMKKIDNLMGYYLGIKAGYSPIQYHVILGGLVGYLPFNKLFVSIL